MGLEMTLHIMHWLVDGYGKDTRITNIVNTREVWIVLAVNPDGAEYDISGGRFHFWRKNRQPTPGTTAIGTDLNRNFGYRWGGGGRTSTNPYAITYRGPYAFSAPETRNIRDFLASRVVNGRQQIRTAITFHEAGRLVMWPYGYTLANIPADMTVDDHNALVIIGKHMAASNGYRPEQASDLYITSGTTRDYEYGKYRIFAYTFELSVVDYPKDTLISSETGRNKSAVLYLIERASCPLAVLGIATRIARCGAFDDDLEVNRGWRVNADGTDTATSGRWQRGDPQPTTTSSGRKQPDGVTSGRYAFITGTAAGSSPSANDLDGGRTSTTSVPISLPAAAGQKLQFRWTFAHDATSRSVDELRVEVIDTSDSSATTVLLVQGAATEMNAGWRSSSIDLSTWAGRTIRLRFSATDAGTNGIDEAGFDDIRVTQPQ
jgi:carboxypeptidase T